ncbi:MAG: hypothetical protein U0401_03325 [Anaerolineae bacterium]
MADHCYTEEFIAVTDAGELRLEFATDHRAWCCCTATATKNRWWAPNSLRTLSSPFRL